MDKIQPSIQKTNNLIQLLFNIYDKHYLYISSKSLLKIESFVDGFMLAQYNNDIETEGSKTFSDFFDWVKTKYNYSGEKGFFNMLNEVLEVKKEEERYELFYKLLNEFLNKTGGNGSD